jgi:hypothetical protein
VASVPSAPAAPARFSTIIGWPISSPSFCASARPMMSDTPPAAYGTTRRIGLLG